MGHIRPAKTRLNSTKRKSIKFIKGHLPDPRPANRVFRTGHQRIKNIQSAPKTSFKEPTLRIQHDRHVAKWPYKWASDPTKPQRGQTQMALAGEHHGQ